MNKFNQLNDKNNHLYIFLMHLFCGFENEHKPNKPNK